MTYSEDLRWRVVSILYIYNAPKVVAEVFGISITTANRWFKRFKAEGRVSIKQREQKSPRWPSKTPETNMSRIIVNVS